jgi:hypothetical protein
MTDTHNDRAPGYSSTLAEQEGLSGVLIYTIGLVLRYPHGHLFLGRQHVSALAPRGSLRPRRPRPRPDGCSPGLLPAHHHGTRQYQQRAGAGVWRAHRNPGSRWLAVDHGRLEREHDAIGRADESAYAALIGVACSSGVGDHVRICSTGSQFAGWSSTYGRSSLVPAVSILRETGTLHSYYAESLPGRCLHYHPAPQAAHHLGAQLLQACHFGRNIVGLDI